MSEFPVINLVPEWQVTGLPNPEDPIDQHLIAFKRIILNDGLPTLSDQKQQIEAIRTGTEGAELTMVTNHLGLIAVAAYPFKSDEANSQVLLDGATEGFLEAASTYRSNALARVGLSLEFSDFALIQMTNQLAEDSEVAMHPIDLIQDRPMDHVFRFMQILKAPSAKPRISEDMEKRRIKFCEKFGVNLDEIDPETIIDIVGKGNAKYFIDYFYGESGVTNEQLANKLGISMSTFNNKKRDVTKEIVDHIKRTRVA